MLPVVLKASAQPARRRNFSVQSACGERNRGSVPDCHWAWARSNGCLRVGSSLLVSRYTYPAPWFHEGYTQRR